MKTPRNGHPALRRTIRRLALPVLVSAFLGPSLFSFATAQDPPQPDFFWPYGRVQLAGQNLEPSQQRVIGIVNGRACGEATTFIAAEAPGVPAGDIGKTVYVVDVLADGAQSGHRPGCGRPGDPVLLYFPESHRMAQQQPFFTVGGQRVDADLGPELVNRLQTPMLANDGLN